jgi:hypothetical protein
MEQAMNDLASKLASVTQLGPGSGGPSAAVKQYGSQLLGALGKEGFADVHARLKSDESIGRPEMVTIAHQFNGPVAPSTSRTKALERIYSRHRKLVEFGG